MKANVQLSLNDRKVLRDENHSQIQNPNRRRKNTHHVRKVHFGRHGPSIYCETALRLSELKKTLLACGLASRRRTVLLVEKTQKVSRRCGEVLCRRNSVGNRIFA